MRRQGAVPSRGMVILDSDPGIDDAVAIALAARTSDPALAAVLTTYGNAPLSVTTRNARYVLDLAGRPDVPVFAGSAGPLFREFDGSPGRHGAHGLGELVPPHPPPEIPPAPGGLLDVLGTLPPGPPVTLITLGPLTNLARALQDDSALVRERVCAHVAMAGVFAADASTSEFNLAADPDAAGIVFGSGLPTRLVPLDVSSRLRVARAETQAWRSSSDLLTRALGAALAWPAGPDRAVHDAAAVAAVVAPGVLDFAPRWLKIGEPGGRLVEDPGGHAVDVAVTIRVQAARQVLARVLAPT